MASLTKEQSEELKRLVKNRLVEIGSYVDDQLPDYIMIMIKNKKTDKQISEDLCIFLGDMNRANEFTNWISNTVKQMTTTTPKLNTLISETAPATDELAIQIETNEFVEDFNTTTTVDNEKSSKTSSSSSSNTIENSRKKVSNNQSTITPSTSSSSLTTTTTKPTLKSTVSVTSRIGAIISHSSDSTSSNSGNSRHKSRNDSEGGDNDGRGGGGGGDDYDDSDGDESYSKRKRKRSSLSSVIKPVESKPTVSISMQPSNTFMKALNDANASTSHQQHQSSTSSSSSKSIADLKLEEIRAKRKSNPIIGNSNQDNNDDSHAKSTMMMRNQENLNGSNKRLRTAYSTSRLEQSNSDLVSVESRVAYHGLGGDKRKAIIESDNDSAALNKDVRRVKVESNNNNGKALKTLDTNNLTETDADGEPKFIVTLTGHEKFDVITAGDERMDPLDDDELIYEEYEDAELENSNNDEQANEAMDDEDEDEQTQKKRLTRCVFWPQCEKGDACPYLHPNKPCTAFPNCSFGQQCHFLHPSCRYDGYCTRLDCPYTHLIKKPGAPAAPHQLPRAPMLDAKSGAASTNPFTLIKQTDTGSDATTAAVAGTAGTTITPFKKLNKPMYSLVNQTTTKTPTEASATEQDGAADKVTATAAEPTATAATQPPPFYAKATTYLNKSWQNPPFASHPIKSNFNIACKFGNACKNYPKCPYLHPTVMNKSQFKWTSSQTKPDALQQQQQQSQQQKQTETNESVTAAAVNLAANNSTPLQVS